MGNTLSAYTESEHEVDLGGDLGKLRGVQFDKKSRRYAGVPYALPPTGNYRWQKPRPIPSNYSYSSSDGSAYDCTQFGPICPQPDYSGQGKKSGPDYSYGEDCLRLNVWTPVEKPGEKGKKWPVMLWLHGGWFQVGDPSHELGMNPTELISTGKLDAIVVAIGYRLSIFGFLAGDALKEETGGEAVGNYGLWDQRLGMEWVYDHIEAFGGDKENITLGGRSAGAYGVHAQTLYDFQTSVSLQREGLFKRLVMYSNAIPTQPKTPEETQPQFDEVCEYFKIPVSLSGSEKLTALRKVSAEDLADAIMKLNYHTFRPVTDEVFIRSGIMAYHSTGQFAQEFQKRKLRVLIGEMLNEETLYAVTNGPEANLESLHLQISNYYAPSTTDRILEHYKIPETNSKSDWQSVFGKIISDGQVRAPSRYLVDSLYTHGVSVRDIWRYRISYRLSFITEKVAPISFGVAHAMDKPFWK
jgi:carboxylesterase type B